MPIASSDSFIILPSLITGSGSSALSSLTFRSAAVAGCSDDLSRTLKFPFTSSTANATVEISNTSCPRKSSTRSSTVIRTLFIICWSITPFFIITADLPFIIFRIKRLFIDITEIRISSITSIKIATTPFNMGCDVSCRGIAAISEISSVTTNSFGCISPICRLPMSRIPRVTKI